MAIPAPENSKPQIPTDAALKQEVQQALQQDAARLKELEAEEAKARGEKQVVAVSNNPPSVTPTPPVPPSVIKGDDTYDPKWDAAEAKIAAIDQQLEAYKGKEGMNPYMWARDNQWDKIKGYIKARNTTGLMLLAKIPNTVVPKVNMHKELPVYGEKPVV
jgi:hypothetical protein